MSKKKNAGREEYPSDLEFFEIEDKVKKQLKKQRTRNDN
jgi:hypothetical protein